MLVIPTMDDWWDLTGGSPAYRRATDLILKDYGYLYLLRYLAARSPARIPGFGHGFNATLFEALAGRDDVEIWGVDDYQGLAYCPDEERWNAQHRESLVARFPRARFVRRLLGTTGSARSLLPEGHSTWSARSRFWRRSGQRSRRRPRALPRPAEARGAR